MKPITKIVSLVSILAVSAGIVLLVQTLSSQKEAALETQPKTVQEPGIIRFAAGAPQLASIRAEAVKALPMPTADPVNGRFVFDENATSRVSSPLTGRVIRLHAEVGERVAKGAVLLEIDAPDLAAAEADLAKAKSDELRKKLAYERARNLHDNEVIARKEFEAADADYQQAKADSQRAALRLRSLNASGHENGRFLLRAPVAGVVVERQVNTGQEVRPDLQNPLFLITDISRLWVSADVPEKNLANVHVGQTVSLETDAYPDQHFTAKVERIGVMVDPGTRRVQVRCTVNNSDLRLKPEMFTRVSFLADGERKGLQVHNTSLVIDGIYNWVFVEKSAGVYEKRKVTLAGRGNEHSFVDGGLAEGERVVTEGALLLNSEAAADAQ
jgi:cobalt-zinc-cadmium efflux system membrane fusion protein